MKMTTQFAAVIVVGVVGFVGLILGLAVLADWSDGAIIAMCTAFGALLVNTIVTIRNQQKTVETLTGQDDKLDTITQQTNGLSERERDDITTRAAVKAIEAYAARMKEGGR